MGDDASLVVRFTADGLPPLEKAILLSQLPRKAVDAQSLMDQASAASEAGRHDEARLIYAKAVAAFPEDSHLINAYAWYLVTAPEGQRRPAEAEVLARRAVALTQAKQWHILDTLAEALLLEGKLAEAKTTNDQAKALTKDEPQDSLGEREKRIAAAAAATTTAP